MFASTSSLNFWKNAFNSLSRDHLKTALRTPSVRPIPLSFQLPLSGSQYHFSSQAIERGVFSFQLPLSGSLGRPTPGQNEWIIVSFNSLSRDHEDIFMSQRMLAIR